MKLVVFDLDGTLVDSRRDLAEAANDLLQECGAAALAEAAVGRMVGDGARVLVQRVFAAAGCVEPPDALPRFLSIYDSRLLRFTRAYPGVEDALNELSTRATLAVLTNKPLGATRRILDGLDLTRFFLRQHVLGGDGPLPRKPDPAGLLHLTAAAGSSPSETTMVGDSLIDWRTAKAAGTRVCLVRNGFGFDGFPVTELAPDDVVVDRASDLPTRIY